MNTYSAIDTYRQGWMWIKLWLSEWHKSLMWRIWDNYWKITFCLRQFSVVPFLNHLISVIVSVIMVVLCQRQELFYHKHKNEECLYSAKINVHSLTECSIIQSSMLEELLDVAVKLGNSDLKCLWWLHLLPHNLLNCW